MKHTVLVGILVLLAVVTVERAQGQSSGPKTLAATMNVYVFPKEGQDATQQSKDEADCYGWAVQNTGLDPFDLNKQAQQQQQQQQQAEQQAAQAEQQAQQVGTGAGASGAVRGAAAGALIGEIASNDAGKGAAYGAAAGLIIGRARGRRANEQATAQAEAQSEQVEKQGQQAQAATAEQLENFKKAFTVCLEAKNYLAKF